ncbi:sensor histidine kinase [Clostridium estertheticum]|uniref:sensor histidine kinase n=1 Tax=Clostridium estertheticum TaxID=238834 RepID=UPI0013EE6EBB|nr:sensor histidine kinase [Clostridium estertheticum]MBZ9609655.1 sensor histidine kinase [Clostridium estertheticum]
MSLSDYFKGIINVILLNIISLGTLVIFLFSVGNTFDTIKVIVVIWITVTITFFTYEYRKRKLYFNNILNTVNRLDKRYLISEVIEVPPYSDSVPYYILMKKASKSMREEIYKSKVQRKDYKEYIEQWIHEVKTPISSIKLIEENNKTNTSRVVLEELENIDRFVEQALFYARSEEVEKDYLIKEISLEQCVSHVLIRNKQIFISSGIDIELISLDKSIYCDNKWLEFILNQIIVNSVKYRTKDFPKVKIYAEDIKNGVQLSIEDNGIGIPSNEINRVFEKGFTGIKGRLNNKSTGIGLYICKKLCDKLGLVITLESNENLYTRVIIAFPKGSFSNSNLLLRHKV